MAKASTLRRRRWLLVIRGVIVVLGLSAAIAWWRLRVPRCEVEPLETLGLDLADDDPVERLDRVHEVVDTLQRSCDVVSRETAFAGALVAHAALTLALAKPSLLVGKSK